MAGLLGDTDRRRLSAAAGQPDIVQAMQSLLAREGWHEDDTLSALLQAPLQRLCAHYLLNEKHDGHARDRVAHFHLTNGARVERLNWLADRSERGLAQSAGLMANYRYQLDHVEKNHEAYTGARRVTAVPAVRKLARG